ncbi:peptide-methionine (S)-S-oxide reductase MsrA, partial [Candidatus Woesearchaeota archaeon]|nr:peptide-methionine (S)-S-oxide reductase MsrA [Candidatus Woesearchaeota archaeon]
SKNPSYILVSTGLSGHAETVEVTFDSSQVSYRELVDYFWRVHDPTQVNKQGPDVGKQYRSAIFYVSDEQKQIALDSKEAFDEKKVFSEKVATEIMKVTEFYPAEEYHQDYNEKNPSYICHELRED